MTYTASPPTTAPRLRRTSRRADAKIALTLAGAALDRDRPLIANLIVTRRCNLSCGYCFEYDKVSPPVPLATLIERVDHLARLRAVFVTLTGGESLLHPEVDEVVRHVRARGMVPFLNTNGYLLTRDWIERLNAAGLHGMQISIDNVTPNDVSKKSLKTLLPKLRLLAEHARFRVRINCVLGASPPEEAVDVARAVIGLGFDMNTSLVRDGDGKLLAADERSEAKGGGDHAGSAGGAGGNAPRVLDERTRAAYETIRGLGKRAPAYLDDDFTRPLLEQGELDWKCRAGARTFHVDEDGLVHLCAPRVGLPAKPLAAYSIDDIRHYYDAPKPCAATCPVAYARHASRLDGWRSQAGDAVALPMSAAPLVQLRRSGAA
jgi:MoaA/NifB/PqqE/SkfB family radical SAM enzyme